MNYDVVLVPPYEEGGRTGGLQGSMRQMDFGKTNVFWPSALGDIAPQVSSGAMTAEEGAEAMIEAINDMIADEGE